MESEPRKRRDSKDEPPDLCELMNKLIEYANLFIREFDNKRPKMREIVGEFQKIVDELKKMQEGTDTVRRAAREVTAGTGIGIMALGLLAAPFTGGASLAAAAVVTAAGGAAVVGTNITKVMKENGAASKVEKLGKEFMEIIEPLKKNLEEIKTTCEEETSGEVQAKKTQSDVEEFQRIRRRISELRTKSEGAIEVTVAVQRSIDDLVMFILRVFSVTATPREDQKLRDAIIQSADQCQRVVDQFDQMKNELKNFTGN